MSRHHRHRRLQVTNRSNLWNDTDEEDNRLSDNDVIEISPTSGRPLSSSITTSVVRSVQDQPSPSLLPVAPVAPVASAASSWPAPQQQQQTAIALYVPRTLQQNNRRYSILPAFPTSIYNNQPSLLLANVPIHKLNGEQLAQRQKGIYSLAYTINTKNFDTPSYFCNDYQLFMSSLIYKYNVDEPILDYNLYRMLQCFRIFADDCIRRLKYQSEQFDLNEKQKKYALEFYLQIDADIFFMKTCSFRDAKARSIDEGLFCRDEPDVRYGLSPCNNCPLCVPSYDMSRRQQPTIRFGPSHKHRFVNGYQSILNCPADCRTRNIIYVMTCPCHEFEYIGETSQRLGDRLWYHRRHVNRIIHEFLIGERNVQLSRTQEKDYETLVKDRMLLYKHAARCPWTIQIFLNFNPIYSCFIPIPINEVARHNRNYILPPTLVLLDSINPTAIASKDRQAIQATDSTRSDESVRFCIRNLPPVPTGYTYSTRQRIQQFQYFKAKQDTINAQDESIDLFNVAIIAVLPLDISEAVRRFIEALFVTHTEAKLNTFGRLLHAENADDDNNSNTNENNNINSNIILPDAEILDRGEWCHNIILPR